MFHECISQTKATDAISEQFFSGRIFGNSFSGDVTFVSTLRCLIYPRMPECHLLSLKVVPTSVFKEEVIDGAYIQSILFSNVQPTALGKLYIVTLQTNEKGNSVYKEIEKVILEEYPYLEKIEKVSLFYQKHMHVDCYVNRDTRTTILITENLNSFSHWHYLQCATLAYFPWYFSASDSVTAEETELMNSLKERDPLRYKNAVSAIMGKYDFRTEALKVALSDFENAGVRNEISRTETSIRDRLADIESYLRTIDDCLKQKSDLEIKLLGLKEKIKQNNGGELLSYFDGNPNLIFEKVEGNKLIFIVKTQLTNYKPEIAEEYIHQDGSFYYAGDTTINESDKRMFLEAVFLDRTIKMNLCAAYSLTIGGGFHAYSDYYYPLECEDSMPNPHINIHSCLGDYRRDFVDAMSREDYTGAIDVAIASCSSINVDEYSTVSYFFKHIWETGDRIHSDRLSRRPNNRCFELPDGRIVTPIEAIEWLKEENDG